MYTFKASNTILLCVCFQQFHIEFLIIHRLFMLCTTVQPKIAMRLCRKVGGIFKKKHAVFYQASQHLCLFMQSVNLLMLVYHAVCKFASSTTIFTSIPVLRAEPHVTTVKITHVHLA